MPPFPSGEILLAACAPAHPLAAPALARDGAVDQAAAAARSDAAGALNRSSMAKVAATEAASRVVDRCVQVMGRWGLVADSPIERYYRQARPMRIYEGASEVLKLGIARALCDEI